MVLKTSIHSQVSQVKGTGLFGTLWPKNAGTLSKQSRLPSKRRKISVTAETLRWQHAATRQQITLQNIS
jgi:hypothetical protein